MGCSVSKSNRPLHEQERNDLHTTTAPKVVANGSSDTQPITTKEEIVNSSSRNGEDFQHKNGLDPSSRSQQGRIEGKGDSAETLTILHFNDVYNIEPREKDPVGGAARFAHSLASFKHLNPLTVFSGDVLNPSMMSSVTKGKHMVPVLNAFDINVAVYGNHDFDFGVDDLIEFNEATNFPWLMSNVIDNTSGGPLANGLVTHMLEWNGRKIGFIGLVEKEWLATLATVDPSEVTFEDYASRGTQLAKELRANGATFIIALTHMRLPNDTRLAEFSEGIDLILGGHDHHYEVKEVNGIKIIKSGSDFREFSKITITFSEDNNFDIDVEKTEITREVPEDPELKAVVDEYIDIMKESMEETLGQVEVELDGRFSSLRTMETNLGNFITDIMHNVSKANVVLLNSGTLRSDTVHPPGVFKKKDLVAILPMPDSMVVLEITGEQLLRALENGVSQWPRHEGRFPQISGMKFAFNPDLAPGNRVAKDSVVIGEEKLDLEKLYTLCTKSYLAKGKDGYDVFAECKILLNEEDGPIIPTVVQNHFDSINILKGIKMSKSKHRQSIVMKHIGESKASILDAEKHNVQIDPKVEGRIINLKNQNVTTAECSENKQDNAEDGTREEEEEEEVTKIISGQVVRNSEGGEASVGSNTTEDNKKYSAHEKQIEPDLATEDDYWDLWEAAKADDIDTVKKLHSEKNIRLTRLQDNKTILHLAAERNSTKVLEYLLIQGQVDPNSLDAILQGVPLHGAAEFDSVEAARLLLDHGSEIDKQDLLGNTALHIACMNNKNNIKGLLLSRGADATLLNSDGETPSL